MKHGFLISAYKNVPTIHELVNHFYCADNYFFIHMDKKSRFFEHSLIQELKSKPNVYLLENRVTVKWGGFSHLRAIITLVEEGLKHQDISYFHLLSDSCFPIKPAEKFFAFFEKNEGKEFITFEKLPISSWAGDGFQRIYYYHLHDLLNVKNKIYKRVEKSFVWIQKITGFRRNIRSEIQPYYGGSTYWSLSRNFLNFAAKYAEENPWFTKIFTHSFCAEEIYFQTILMNSPFKSNAVDDNLRYVDWKRRNGNCPANLDDSDFNLVAASDKLIGRKFIYPLGKNLLERVKTEIK
jgi:hypothetical protein